MINFYKSVGCLYTIQGIFVGGPFRCTKHMGQLQKKINLESKHLVEAKLPKMDYPLNLIQKNGLTFLRIMYGEGPVSIPPRSNAIKDMRCMEPLKTNTHLGKHSFASTM